MAYTIKVYTSFKRSIKEVSFSFTVNTKAQVTDHVKQIFKDGYRRVLSTDTVEWYPPHKTERIEVSGTGFEVGYKDTDITP